MEILKQIYSLHKNTTVTIKALFTITLLCLFITTSCNTSDDNSPTTNGSNIKDEIDNQEFANLIEEYITVFPENTQVAIAIIDNTSTEFIGVINDNGTLRTIDNADNIFEIGSITKVFTSICLSELIATNEASLNETIQQQFDFPLLNGGNISLLQLANHTSGLPRLPTNVEEVIDFDINDPYANYTVANLESYLQNHITLNTASGTAYEYSNLGMGMLGYILAKKRGVSYEELIQSVIMEPLQMHNSTTLIANVDTSKLVIGQDQYGNAAVNWNHSDTMSGSGSIKSSVVDLEKFVRKNFENNAVYNLPQETTFNIATNYIMGLGWHIIESEGFRILTHNGGTAGYTSYLAIDKINKRAVIILSNVSATTHPNSENIDDLGDSLLESISLQ